jgi:hypothetical protein
MKRRQYIAAVGTAGASLLAGCTGNDDSDDGGDGTDTPRPDNSDTPTETPNRSATPDGGGDTEGGPLAVLDSYIEAAREEDFDALGDAMHSRHPFNPDNLSESEMENASFEFGSYENYERELVDDEFSTDDIEEMPTIGRWFEQMDVTLADVLDGEKAALAEVTYETTEDGSTVEKTEQLTLLTEDGEWQVFFPYQEPVEVPQGEPVDDDQYRVVDGVEFDTASERATVNVSGVGDIEAKELVVYSASLKKNSKAWSQEAETLPSLNYLVTPFDPEGDEIVVTIRFEDREIVVHRESYPQESADENDALRVLESYVAGINNEDFDAVADAMHSSHPAHPDNLSEEERENASFGSGYTDPETTIIDEAFGTDDIREWDASKFWFNQIDATPEEVLAGEEAVLGGITYTDSENGTTVERTEQIILLTDDGDWRVFVTYDRRIAVPQGEPVDNDQYRVVDSVEFDTETERVEVNFSDVGDIEAKELVVYSTSLGDSSRAWSKESETLPSAAVVTSPFDPEGDEIVVTIRFEDREIVIHRETYEPDANN